MIPVEEHIKQLGADGILILSTESGESASGHLDWTKQTIACRISGKPHRVTAVSSHNAYKSGTEYSIHEKDPISEAEYASLQQSHPAADTPDTHKGIAQRDALRDQLEALTPRCPKCTQSMREQSGRHGKFWGCRSFPRCKGTQLWDDALANRLNALREELRTM